LVKKVRRWVPIKNLGHLPLDKADIIRYGGRRGRALCELEFHWIINNTKKYEKLLGKR